jgi:ATP-binding cassette, subfamily B, bacterial
MSNAAPPALPLVRVFSYLRRYPLLAAAQLTCAVGATLTVVVFPKIVQHIIDVVIPGQLLDQLLPLVLIVTAAEAARQGLDCLRIRLNNNFEQRVIYDVRSDLYQKIQSLPVRWFDDRPTGDIMTRVAEDVTSMERILIDGIEQGTVALLQILIVALVLFTTNAQLASIALIPLPFLIAGAYLYTRHARDRHRAVRRETGAMNSVLHDNIAGVRQIKAYAAEPEELARFNQSSDRVRQATLHVMRMWSLYRPGMAFIGAVGSILVLGFGGAAAIRGELTAGELTSFLLLLAFFYEPVRTLHQLNQLAQGSRAAAERVFEILDAPNEPGLVGGQALASPVRGHIRFDRVSFSYSDDDPDAPSTLHQLELEALPGQMIALVGHTGAGKSTIINLLTRFYEHGGGTITLDGVDVSLLDKRALRQAIGYVTQESFLFDGTVRENLAMGERSAGDAQMHEALQAAGALSFVQALPDGLDTAVGERGIRLSVGEKQRLSIARALLKNPPILLLDEATASVDTETERQIQEALDRLLTRRTSIVIAHRLSTVRHADRIYVLDHGRVIEQGTHDQLLALGGTYTDLCRSSLITDTPT